MSSSNSKETNYVDINRNSTPAIDIKNTFSSCWDDDELVLHNIQVAEALRLTMARQDLSDDEKIIVQRLAMKSFHLPGNTFWEDWVQFVCNNHIIVSFCFAHPLHPFKKRERVINLIASLAFGLVATCCVVLYYYFNKGDMNNTLFSLRVFGDHTIRISCGMFFSGIFGGICNVLFDFAIWFIQACPPCQPGGLLSNYLTEPMKQFWIWVGSHIALLITILGICLAAYVTTLRASVLDDGDPRGISTGIGDYVFVVSFFMEVAIAQFVMFPLVAGTIFSGVLGCFRIPGLGGRPYQVWKAEQRRKAIEGQETEKTKLGERIQRQVWADNLANNRKADIEHGLFKEKEAPLISNRKEIELSTSKKPTDQERVRTIGA